MRTLGQVIKSKKKQISTIKHKVSNAEDDDSAKQFQETLKLLDKELELHQQQLADVNKASLETESELARNGRMPLFKVFTTNAWMASAKPKKWA